MFELVNLLLKVLAKILEFIGKMFKTDILLAIAIPIMWIIGITYSITGLFWLSLLGLVIILATSTYNREELNLLDEHLRLIDYIKSIWANKQQITNLTYTQPPIQPGNQLEPIQPPVGGQEPPTQPPVQPFQPVQPMQGGFQINRKSGFSSKAREKDSILELEIILERNLKGQDAAIRGVVDGLKRAAVINNTKKSTLNFLMTGPTGTGKTEMAKLVAQNLKRPFIRYDMGNYKNKEQLWQLLGSPQGYMGGEGKLTGFVKSNPNACVLFDEIEKGSDEVFDFMLPMLDEAIVKDNKTDQTVDFSKTIVFFTTNLVTNTPEEAKDNPEIVRDLILNKGFLRQEFIARIKNIVPFFEFSEEDIIDIVAMQLQIYLKNTLDPKNEDLAIIVDGDVADFIASKVDRKYGVRNVAQNIERYIGNPLTSELFNKQGKKIKHSRFWVENESIKLEVQC